MTLNPELVVVDVFENRTNDDSMEELGRMAAGYITAGLRGVVDFLRPELSPK